MKILISGKITGLPATDVAAKFYKAKEKLIRAGHDVINPYGLSIGVRGENWRHEDYMHLTLAALEICDAVYMLQDWEDSPGAIMEHETAVALGKRIIYEGEGPL